MAELSRDKHDYKNTSRSRWRLWVPAALVPAVVIGALVWMTLSGESVDEKLAAVEAARAISDSENAAIFYDRLMADANATSFVHHPKFLDRYGVNLTLYRPWSRKEYPELADWIDERRWLIEELMTVLQFEQCRFPIDIDLSTPPSRVNALVLRKWALLLARAAGNDVGEGRIDNAIEKWRCITRMAVHLYQQPTSLDITMGTALEHLSFRHSAVFVVESEAEANHLKKIESMQLQTRDDWQSVLEMTSNVDELIERKLKEDFGPLGHLEFEFYMRAIVGAAVGLDKVRDMNRLLYVRTLASRRGTHILIALRRHRIEHGNWPDSLDTIRPRLAPEILVDPFNKGEFVYKRTDDGFTLYSKGRNNVDEDGQYESGSERGPDDWPIWPPRSRRAREKTADSE
jgi:hypothetical protein